jgi:Divergent InlB B-repeat domain
MRSSLRFAAVLVTLIVLASGLYVGHGVAPPSPSHIGLGLSANHALSTPSPATSHAAPTTPPSGRGTFFLNYPQPTASATNSSCRYNFNIPPVCMNNTGNPSLTVTPSGGFAAAYTAFAAVNPCSAAANQTATVIGVDYSANGTVWNAPVYLDNPVCSEQFNYSSAMMPAIASLANGTLVLAYVEYNLSYNQTTCAAWDWYPAPAPCLFSAARLVVTRSFNNGVSWTTPTVIVASQNTSFNATGTSWIPAQPSISVTGDTVYLAWSNFTNPLFYSSFFFGNTPAPPLISLHLSVSTTGGASWGAPRQLPTVPGSYMNQVTSVAYGPALTVASNGTLYIAYATNLTADSNFLCNPYGACGTLFINQSMDVVVAQSVNNGSTFSVSTAAAAVPVDWNGATWISYPPGTIVAPAPSIALDPATGQLYVAYAGGEIGNLCFTFGCNPGEYYENLWLATSTNNGGSWTNAAVGDQALGIASGANSSEWLMTPSVGVGANGTVYIGAVYDNGTVCASGLIFVCDRWSSVLFESTDHGATFSPPFQVDPTSATIDPYPLWDGFTTSMAMKAGIPWFAWTQEINPPPLTYCNVPSATCYSQVIVSTLFTGTGLTATFNETGLPAGDNWSLNLLGNARAGAAGLNLSVSGIPVGANLSWSIPGENSTIYGVRYFAVSTPSPPYLLTAPTTIRVTFVEEALLNITAIPATQPGLPFSCASPYYGGFGFDCANQNVTPFVGQSYVQVGVPFSYGAAPIAGFSFVNCYQCMNLSFLAWTGVGNGSWNTTTSNGSTSIYGPVNETVTFALLGFCSNGLCVNASYNYTFAERGLPNGTSWAVTFGNQTQTSTTPFLGFNGTGGPIPFTVWVVPFNATLEYVGTPSVPSPITALQGIGEVVTFVLAPIARGDSPLSVSATGLPSGVSTWGFSLGGAALATPSSGAVYTVPNGPVVLNASAVYGPNGTGAYPTGFRVTPQIVGSATSSLPLGGLLNVSSPVAVTATYAPEYWLTVTNSSGGSVSGPPGQWVHGGQTVNLTATPDPGFSFVGWSGTGSGSVTSPAPTIPVRPSGPVSELATFVAVVPTFTLTVSATGVLTGVPITVSVGTADYTELAPFTISGLTSGSYALVIPTVYPNGTAGERFVVTAVASSLSLSGGSIDVTASGTLSITYAEQVTLLVGSASNGTTTPAAGTYWENAGVSTSLDAVPNTGYVFVSWNGTGLGEVTSGSASIAVLPTGPVTETPVFAPRVLAPPATFTLTVTETGLPSGTTWSSSIGSNGASGTAALVLSGLNGTYTVVVPTVLGGTGVRYVPGNGGNYSSDVTHNASLVVSFTTQYAVTVLATPGGTATPSSAWVTSGATVNLVATANSSYQFVNWTGTGNGAYSGTVATDALVVSGPVSEFATFAPSSSSHAASAGGVSDWILPIGLLVVLLIVGLVIGLVLSRGRRPPTAPAEGEEGTMTESGETGEVPVWSEGPVSSPPPGPTAPSDEDGSESIYGGGSG